MSEQWTSMDDEQTPETLVVDEVIVPGPRGADVVEGEVTPEGEWAARAEQDAQAAFGGVVDDSENESDGVEVNVDEVELETPDGVVA